jgi:hypothetical protein
LKEKINWEFTWKDLKVIKDLIYSGLLWQIDSIKNTVTYKGEDNFDKIIE